MKYLKIKFFLGVTLAFALGVYSLYFLPSGMPQLSDLFFLLFSVLSVLTFKDKIRALPKEWSLMVLIVLVVSMVWSIVLQQPDMLINFLFFLFNYIVCFCFYNFISKDSSQAIFFIRFGVMFSLIVSSLGIYFYSEGGRNTGFFNNPNQLAFYSLLMACIVMLVNKFRIIGFVNIISILLSVIGVMYSASISAILSLLVVFFAYILSIGLSVKKLFVVLLTLLLLIVTSFVLFSEQLMQALGNRILRLDSKVESIKGERNYDRIFNNLEYTVFGAGEGAYTRFGDFESLEIHSSFGTMLFSYGVLGFLVFIIFIFKLIKNYSFPYQVLIFSPLVYSTTHMGLRSTLFWFFVTLVIYFKEKSR